MVAIQKRIHGQVFSTAAIAGIVALIEDDVVSIAEAAAVDLIADQILHPVTGVELVFITQHMCTPYELGVEDCEGSGSLGDQADAASEMPHDH